MRLLATLATGALAASALAAGALAVTTFAASACGTAPSGVLDACADSMPTCFSNADCDPANHCSIPPTADPTVLISCCLPGPRGTGEAGAPCSTLDDCQSAVCAYTPSGPFCSTSCQPGTSNACPPSLPTCVGSDAGVDGSTVYFCGLPP